VSPRAPDEPASNEFKQATHELNNLVAVLLGHVDALSRVIGEDPGLRRHVDALTEALRRSENVARKLSLIAGGGEAGPTPEATKEALRGTETVLLVDDEASLRTVTARFLGMNGYKVLEAGDAKEAQIVFNQSPRIDVVVTDAMMGEMSGFDLARALKVRAPALKVLFVSGHSPDELRRQSGTSEDLHILAKPFRPKDLLHRLRDMLDAGKASAG
jgi:CheY-like chemotaxis protein